MTTTSTTRRTFLKTSGALAVAGAGVALAGCTTSPDTEPGESEAARTDGPTDSEPTPPEPSPAAVPEDLSSWENVRAQFELDPELAHLSAYVLAAHPAPVRAAIERWRAALDADAATVVHDDRTHDDAVRDAAARYLRIPPHEVALTDSTTAGLGLVYNGLRLQPGDHVLTTTHDFYSTHESLRLAAERTGASVERVALYDDPTETSVETMVTRFQDAIRAETRVVALTWVHSGTGVKIPVRAMADVLAEVNADRDPTQRALLCLDAVHGLGAEEAQPDELGCDVYISGTHKWLFGPRGTGLVWARELAGDEISPIIPPFNAPSFINWITGGDTPSPFGLGITAGGYKPYEHRWAVADAFDFHLAIGLDRVAARTQELATRLKDGLAELAGVRLVTPRDPELSSGLVCCDVPGDPDAVLAQLRDAGILASYTPYREQHLRLGPSIVVSPDEVDAAVDAIAGLG